MADNRGKRSRIDNFIGWVLRLFTSTSARQIQSNITSFKYLRSFFPF